VLHQLQSIIAFAIGHSRTDVLADGVVWPPKLVSGLLTAAQQQWDHLDHNTSSTTSSFKVLQSCGGLISTYLACIQEATNSLTA